VISGFSFFLDYFSQSGHELDMDMISKWENLQNSGVFKFLFSSLYIFCLIFYLTCYCIMSPFFH